MVVRMNPAADASGAPASGLEALTAKYVFNARILVALTSPVIYSLIIPFALVDLWASLYQAVCFRVYEVPQVPRGRYIILDRAGLPYLNALEKLYCAYCSYVSGVIAYVREIGSRTEQYWCPIKHARRRASPLRRIRRIWRWRALSG